MTPDLFTHAAVQRHQEAMEEFKAFAQRMDTRGCHKALKPLQKAATEALNAENEARGK